MKGILFLKLIFIILLVDIKAENNSEFYQEMISAGFESVKNKFYDLYSNTIKEKAEEYFLNLKEQIFSDPIKFIPEKNFTVKDSKIEYRTMEEKIINAGFRVETHKIVTEDNYILTAFRIPGRLGESPTKKKPITLTHGLLDDAHTWVSLNNTNNMAIQLAEKNYDVWIFNVRGNIFSFEHMDRINYDSSDLFGKYWEFSWDEIAKYDVRANIEYVKKITGYEKLIYVGHSQGTLIYFLSYTLHQDFIESSVEKFIGLGPMVTLKSSQSPYIKFFDFTKLLDLLYYLKYGNLLVVNTSIANFIHWLCSEVKGICTYLIETIVAINGNDKFKPLSDLFYFEPGGTSVKNLLHWVQLYRKGKQTYFDYGSPELNKKYYGTPTPPEYDMSTFKNYNIETYLALSNNDPFSYPKDVEELTNYIPISTRNKILTVKNYGDYSHLDYVWANDAATEVYPDLFEFLGNNTGNSPKKSKFLDDY